jgi:hypothetical protein
LKPRLSVVVPHWPIDDEVNRALAVCLASLPGDCEKVVVVNEGTGFARNVNIGLGLATGEFYEDDDYLERLRRARVPTAQIPTVHVWSRRIGLTMSKLPDKGQGWLRENARRFEEKWGWVPPPTDPGATLEAS